MRAHAAAGLARKAALRRAAKACHCAVFADYAVAGDDYGDGVFIIGLCTGAFGYLLRKLSKNRLPKWIIPIAAGGGMFAYLAYYDYAWFDFKRSQLPEGSVVIQEYREPDFFRPWSYLAPSVNQFDVVDGQYRRHQQEGDTIVEYIVYRFIKDPSERMLQIHQVLNCTSRERVALPDPAHRAQQPGQAVEMVLASDRMLQTACR